MAAFFSSFNILVKFIFFPTFAIFISAPCILVFSIVPFQLIDYVIGELEKRVFDIELLQNIRDPNMLLDAPINDKGFIEFLLNNDIEEKLHTMYQGETAITGYIYIIEKIVVFDLFLIYLVLKNYPFYVLSRDRLEILFKSLKKYKSFPYPIGSIGNDLFNLLIHELYQQICLMSNHQLQLFPNYYTFVL